MDSPWQRAHHGRRLLSSMSPVLLLLLLLLIEVVPGERKSAMTSSAKIASERSPFSRLIMQLRGGRRSDHLPRSFKRALRRHTKSRLMEEKKKRGKGLDALIERLNATNKLPPPETEEVEAPRTWWWKPLMEDDPPDLSVLLDNDPPPPSQRPLGPDGKPVCANYDHLAKKMRNVEPVQEELWAACGCYAFDDPVDRTYSRIDIPEIVRCLKEGADVNMGHPLDRNNTPLHYLCRNGSVEAIETVIAHGANVSAINNGLMQWTPLHAAAYMGMVEAVQVLVKHGANVTCVDDDGWMPIHFASYGGHADVCKVLVELGCPVDIRFPEFSWSALHIAASRGFPDVCVTLMEVGADWHAKDFLFHDAFDVASKFGMRECSAIFKSKMREESIYDLECLETTIEGKKVLLVVSGQFAGNVYSHVSDPGKEESQYLGRLRIEDHTIDPSIPEEQGCQQVDDDEEMPEPPDWAYHTDGTPWEYTMSLMEEIKVEGEKYLLEAGTAAVYQYRKPHRFLGLLRKDKTIDFGARMPGWGDTPFNVQEPMMPGRPSFVIGKLNGSIDAARQYNKKLHEGPWKKMHEYGIFKLNVDGISSYPPECEEGQPCPSLEPSSRKKSSKKSSTDLMELDESDEVRKPRKIKGLGPKTPPAKSFEDQLADAMWEIRSKELQRSVRYEAVGEDVVGIRQDKHPLWRKTACKCLHCEDLRKGKTGIICHCRHCFLEGYWVAKYPKVVLSDLV